MRKIILSLVFGLVIANAQANTPYTAPEAQSVETSEESQIRDLRTQEVQQLRQTLGRRLPQNRRADLYLRLAEAYFEAYRTTFLIEGRIHEKRLSSGQADKIIQRNLSRPWLRLAIQACQEILSFGIRHPKLDEVLYMLAYSHAELEQEAESLKFYQRLTTEYPTSGYASEGWRERGEGAFRKRQYPQALGYFKEALKHANPEKTPRILHRMAWSHYRSKQYAMAISTMKQAVERARQSGEKFLAIKDEALRDLALFMTEANQVGEAIAYFKDQAGGGEQLPKLLERLGRQLERGVEYDQAIQTYESIIKIAPDSAHAYRAKARLYELEMKKNRTPKAIARIEGIKLPSGADTETLQVAHNLKVSVRSSATELHKRFRKGKDAKVLPPIELLYEGYLRNFLNTDEAEAERHEIQMYLAEVKRDLGKNKEASSIYKEVVKSGDSKYSKEAASLWVASLSDVIKNREVKKSAELSELEKDFISASDDLADTAGNLPEGREASLRVAQLLAGYPLHQKDAQKRLKTLIEKYPNSPQAVTGARLWVQMLADRLPKNLAEKAESDEADDLKDAVETIQKAPGLLEQDKKLGGKLAQALVNQKRVFEVGQIASYEKEGNFAAAAKAYETLAQSSSDPTLYKKAYLNASTAYQKGGDYDSVLRVVSAWRARDPKSSEPRGALQSAATHALVTSKFDWSSKLFANIGYKFDDAEALETAGRIAEGDGQVASAQTLYKEYLKRFSKNRDAAVVEYALARLDESANQDAEAEKHYRSCGRSSSDIASLCKVRLAEALLRDGKIAPARTVLNELTQKQSKKSPFLAYAKFQLGYLYEKEARSQKLKLPEKVLQKGIEQRLQHLERLSKLYDDALDAGGHWGIAALDRLASWVESVADELEAVEPPKEAKEPAQIQKFKTSLQGLASPLRKRSVLTWVKAYDRATRDQIYSTAVPQLHDRLAAAKVQGVFRAQGAHARFRLSGQPQDEGSVQRLLANTRDALAWLEYGNLLWFRGKPGLARVAYDQSISVDAKNPAALNNRAVVALMNRPGPTDAWNVYENAGLFDKAIQLESGFVPARFNKASLLTYYRLFSSSEKIWNSIVSQDPNADVLDGLAMSQAGTGHFDSSKKNLEQADGKGASDKRFTHGYLQAVYETRQEDDGKKSCVSILSDLLENKLNGFEKDSTERFKAWCSVE